LSRIQEQLNETYKNEKEVALEINTETINSYEQSQLTLNGEIIERVDDFKYLESHML